MFWFKVPFPKLYALNGLGARAKFKEASVQVVGI